MLKNVKMPTIAGILTFMSSINFVLGRVEHLRRFITSGPGQSSDSEKYKAYNSKGGY